MFKEKLHNDIDKITPSAELLDRVSLMMKEEASRKKPKIYMTAVKYGSLAAAVCLITALFIAFGNGSEKTKPEVSGLSVKLMDNSSDKDSSVSLAAAAETAEETRAVTEALATEAPTAYGAVEGGVCEDVAISGASAAYEEAETMEAEEAPRAAEMIADEYDGGAEADLSYAEESAMGEIMSVSEGYILPCTNGMYLLINDTVGAVTLSSENNDNSIFDDFTGGDVVRVTHGIILESYPGQTTISSIEKISEGELSDIPDDTLKQLEELGWLPLTE